MRSILFLSGLPRSGTKLLRDLLNNHPLVSIPEIETVLIPYMTSKFGIDLDLNKKENFYLVCDEFERSTFHHHFKKRNLDIDIHTLFNPSRNMTWCYFFESILKFYGPKEFHEGLIVGDKTPGYIAHTDILLHLWPEAKIIHIIRDPRDYAISARNVWNKNLFRAVDRWNRIIMSLDKKTNLNASNFCTVYYEHLIEDPETVLLKICRFLGIEYSNNMAFLRKPAENFGDAKGLTEIIKTNKNKYKNILTDHQIFKIEQIVYNGAKLHGYNLEHDNVQPKAPGKTELLFYKLLDGWHSMMFHIREKGLLTGANYFLQLHKENI